MALAGQQSFPALNAAYRRDHLWSGHTHTTGCKTVRFAKKKKSVMVSFMAFFKTFFLFLQTICIGSFCLISKVGTPVVVNL